ncbi:hypothetical protein [Microbispora sp. NBC_01389]|uniref:hypothetical protein n=1 Tax=Microbispora sp. NBC_01389 TaxID=2903584 RepID=UPI00325402BB
MTVLARRVASLPVRTAGDTWLTIVDLLSAPGTAAHNQLLAASNVAAMLISEEYTADNPIDVAPVFGPRVRIYTLHGDNAIEDNDAVLPLPSKPVVGDGWVVSLPCGEDDFDDASEALSGVLGVIVRPLGQEKATAASTANTGGITSAPGVIIDLSGGLK